MAASGSLLKRQHGRCTVTLPSTCPSCGAAQAGHTGHQGKGSRGPDDETPFSPVCEAGAAVRGQPLPLSCVSATCSQSQYKPRRNTNSHHSLKLSAASEGWGWDEGCGSLLFSKGPSKCCDFSAFESVTLINTEIKPRTDLLPQAPAAVS